VIIDALSLHDRTSKVTKIQHEDGESEAVLPFENPTITGQMRKDLIETLVTLLTAQEE